MIARLRSRGNTEAKQAIINIARLLCTPTRTHFFLRNNFCGLREQLLWLHGNLRFASYK